MGIWTVCICKIISTCQFQCRRAVIKLPTLVGLQLWIISYTVRLVPLRFWRMVHNLIVSMRRRKVCSTSTSTSVRDWPGFATMRHVSRFVDSKSYYNQAIRSYSNWHLPCSQCMETCYVSSLQNDIYWTLTRESSPEVNILAVVGLQWWTVGDTVWPVPILFLTNGSNV